MLLYNALVYAASTTPVHVLETTCKRWGIDIDERKSASILSAASAALLILSAAYEFHTSQCLQAPTAFTIDIGAPVIIFTSSPTVVLYTLPGIARVRSRVPTQSNQLAAQWTLARRRV